MRIEVVMAGANGDSRLQFIELRPAEYVIPPEIVPLDGVVCFHDNAAPDLRSAVSHYISTAFRFSEAALIMERDRIFLSEDEIDDLVAFLEAISVDPSAD